MKQQYYLALDIGGSAVKYAVMNQQGVIIVKGDYPSPTTSIDDFWQQFDLNLSHLFQQYYIIGLAISAPGSVDCDSSVIYGHSALRYLHGPNFREYVEHHYHINCEIENDANCAALAELWQAKEVDDFCLLVIGSGVGGSMVIDGKVHHGQHLHGAEFGYMFVGVDDAGRPVTLSGCAATRSLIQNSAKVLGLQEHELNGKQVFELAESGNQRIQAVIDKWYQMLAYGIYNVQYISDPNRIILGGAISSRTDFIARIEQKLDQIFIENPFSSVRPQLSVCQAGNDANLIGALYHYLQRQSTD
ncbi:ROK family protein [Vibrio algicola]|uniref:ROK family protein n=1 Tax=Vibrio algicola TaxID=2662262 RepID=A0A5Q0TEU2_9VIBR|nr:ROK family protein [Vibrio algicola]